MQILVWRFWKRSNLEDFFRRSTLKTENSYQFSEESQGEWIPSRPPPGPYGTEKRVALRGLREWSSSMNLFVHLQSFTWLFTQAYFVTLQFLLWILFLQVLNCRLSIYLHVFLYVCFLICPLFRSYVNCVLDLIWFDLCKACDYYRTCFFNSMSQSFCGR